MEDKTEWLVLITSVVNLITALMVLKEKSSSGKKSKGKKKR